jgi:hypothetical protein
MKIEDCKGVTHLIELGWVVTYEAEAEAWSDDHPCSMAFSIWMEDDYRELVEESESLAPGATLAGNIKWDGCSNWRYPDGVCLHLCGKKHVTGIMNAMALCYPIAGKFMPEAND